MSKRLLVVAVFLLSLQLFAGVELNGRSDVEIAVGAEPSYVAQFAAKELSYFLGKALGKEIAVRNASNAVVRIIVGLAPDGKPLENGDSHIVVRDNGTLYIW